MPDMNSTLRALLDEGAKLFKTGRSGDSELSLWVDAYGVITLTVDVYVGVGVQETSETFDTLEDALDAMYMRYKQL